jgi:eukaryotic-like serine/threonine-protein kinase
MRPRPPRLPGYVLGSRLGGGPTCDVYSAAAERGLFEWAVKVLRDDAARDFTNVQLLRREARAGLAVRHPHLVRIVRGVTDGEAPLHLIMRRVSGRSLRAVLRGRGWLGSRLAGSIARQVAAALAALHAAGFVHGDVKPENIHLGPGKTATLLDLGFAHRPGEDTGLLGAGFVLGTANYVAPELCEQPETDGPAADVFSLGVTLFELLTGELPYPDGGIEETMVRHRDSHPESLGRWRGAWPAGMADLVDRMLNRDPDERPTAAQVGRELTKLLGEGREREA